MRVYRTSVVAGQFRGTVVPEEQGDPRRHAPGGRMISRRALIGCGVAASALGATTPWSRAIASAVPPSLPLAILVVDARFAAARVLASRTAPGVRRVVLPRDVLDLWHRDIEPVARSGSGAIAGVTTERGAFLFQTLGADHRLRVRSRTVHAASAGTEPLVSWVLDPK